MIHYTKESYITYLDVCACGDLNEKYLNHVLNCLRIGSVRPAGPTMGAACAVGITVVAHRPGAPGSFRRSILNKIPLSAMLEGGHKTNRMRGGHEGKHPQRWREGISANVGDRRHWAVNPIPCHERIVQLLGQIERREELGL